MRTGLGKDTWIHAAAVALLAVAAQGASYTWNTGSETWDDSDTANWNPPGIPTNSDSVYLTLASNANIND